MDIDQTPTTTKITPELIDAVVRKIVREIHPEKIIFFGSYARGDFEQDSDLDLLIIKDTTETNRKTRRKIDALLWGREFSIDLLLRKPSEVEWNFKANNPFYIASHFQRRKSFV